MERGRDHLLAGPGLPEDQHGKDRTRDAIDEVPYRPRPLPHDERPARGRRRAHRPCAAHHRGACRIEQLVDGRTALGERRRAVAERCVLPDNLRAERVGLGVGRLGQSDEHGVARVDGRAIDGPQFLEQRGHPLPQRMTGCAGRHHEQCRRASEGPRARELVLQELEELVVAEQALNPGAEREHVEPARDVTEAELVGRA